MAQQSRDHLPDLLQRLREHQGDGAAARQLLEQAVQEHPGDPRLYLLLGAERVHGKDVDGAEAAYIAALQLAPDFAIARFQLGLLQLTSGRPAAAFSTWAPLEALGERDPLRLFKQGLEHMARDQFDEARRLLEEGIAENRENPPLNRDMQMVLERIAAVQGQPPAGQAEEAAPAADHFLVSAYRKTS